MTYDVFISYSTDDQKIVEGLSAYLEQNKIRCFVAYRDIPRGVVWAKAITEAIENSKLMVVVFSEHFNRSEQVDREIEMCIEERKPILTFRIEDTAFTGAKKYYLKNINWIDAFPNPEKCFGDLLVSLKKLFPELGKEDTPHSTRNSINDEYAETSEVLKGVEQIKGNLCRLSIALNNGNQEESSSLFLNINDVVHKIFIFKGQYSQSISKEQENLLADVIKKWYFFADVIRDSFSLVVNGKMPDENFMNVNQTHQELLHSLDSILRDFC
ncbi:MAG: toll/interleukin-1 receptor domain-containing protein [Marinilabiliaceae bacterium]|nr:toll/interleukin-1 receptor domain-containing protein [Marinilabiliaceae bacterium]